MQAMPGRAGWLSVPAALVATLARCCLALAAGAVQAQSYEAVVAAEVRAAPAIDAPVRLRLEVGQQVQADQLQGGWVRVRQGQVQGWVRLNRLKPLQPAVSARPERLASLFTADSTTPTATTGVRGLGHGWVRSAVPDLQAVQQMRGFSVTGAQLLRFAHEGGLHGSTGAAPRQHALPDDLDRTFAAVILGACPLQADPEVQRYVNLVGQWLVHPAGDITLGDDVSVWRFAVIVSDAVASFSTPGGDVFVTEGLLRQLGSEAELAAALAHEVAHVALGHQRNVVMGSSFSQPGYGTVAPQMQAGDAMEQIYVHGMDAADEFAADRLALQWLARGGYSPGGMVALLRGYAGARGDDARYALLRQSHPAAQQRLSRLQAQPGGLNAQEGVVGTERYLAMQARL